MRSMGQVSREGYRAVGRDGTRDGDETRRGDWAKDGLRRVA